MDSRRPLVLRAQQSARSYEFTLSILKFSVSLAAVCHLFASRASPRSVRMRACISICCVCRANWMTRAACLTACGGRPPRRRRRLSATPGAWALSPLSSSAVWLHVNTAATRNRSQFKLFDVHVHPSLQRPQICNKTAPNKLSHRILSGESLNYSDYCFVFFLNVSVYLHGLL